MGLLSQPSRLAISLALSSDLVVKIPYPLYDGNVLLYFLKAALTDLRYGPTYFDLAMAMNRLFSFCAILFKGSTTGEQSDAILLELFGDAGKVRCPEFVSWRNSDLWLYQGDIQGGGDFTVVNEAFNVQAQRVYRVLAG